MSSPIASWSCRKAPSKSDQLWGMCQWLAFAIDLKDLNSRLLPAQLAYPSSWYIPIHNDIFSKCSVGQSANLTHKVRHMNVFQYRNDILGLLLLTQVHLHHVKGWKRDDQKWSVITSKTPKRKLEGRKGINTIFKCATPPFIMFLIPFSPLLFSFALLLFVPSIYILQAL